MIKPERLRAGCVARLGPRLAVAPPAESQRRPHTAGNAGGDSPPKPGASMAVALHEADEDQAGRSQGYRPGRSQRQRLKEEREASVLAGLDELDRWILDQLNLGLAGFAQRAAQSTKTLSTRLVDAKAPGLASRLDMLGADVFRVPEQMRSDMVVERLAALR